MRFGFSLRAPHALTLGALFAALAGTALLQTDAAAQDSYIWTFDNKVGDTEQFRTYIRIVGKTADASNDINIATKSASKHTYKDVSADGTATYEQFDEKFEVTFNNMPIADKPAERKPVTLIRGRNGVFIKRTNPNADLATAYREKALLALQSMPAPEKPVKVGETWTATMPNPLLKSKTITVTSTLVGTEKVLGQDALKVNVKMEFPSAIDAMENEIVKLNETYYLDARTHALLRARYTIANPVLPFPTGKTEAKIFVTRVIAGVNDKEDPDEVKLIGAEADAK